MAVKGRKTGYKPSTYKVGDGGLEEAEALMGRSKQLIVEAQDYIKLALKDMREGRLDNETSLDILRAVNESAKAVAALFREERTNDRFSAEKAEDMDDNRRKAIVLETYRRLPLEARGEVAKMMLEMSENSGKPSESPSPAADPGGGSGNGQILRLRPRDGEVPGE